MATKKTETVKTEVSVDKELEAAKKANPNAKSVERNGNMVLVKY
jgi:hypothetical protein